MGGRGGDSVPPGEEIPKNRSDQSGEDDPQHATGLDLSRLYRFGNGISHTMVFEYEECNGVEDGRPKNRLKRSEYFGGNNGRNGIRCIVKTVDVVE